MQKTKIVSIFILFFSFNLWAGDFKSTTELEEVIPSGTYRLLQATGKKSGHCPNEFDPILWRNMGAMVQFQITPEYAITAPLENFKKMKRGIIELKMKDNKTLHLQKLTINQVLIKVEENNSDQINCVLSLKEKVKD